MEFTFTPLNPLICLRLNEFSDATYCELTIIEGEIPPELISEIRKLPGTRSVTVY